MPFLCLLLVVSWYFCYIEFLLFWCATLWWGCGIPVYFLSAVRETYSYQDLLLDFPYCSILLGFRNNNFNFFLVCFYCFHWYPVLISAILWTGKPFLVYILLYEIRAEFLPSVNFSVVSKRATISLLWHFLLWRHCGNARKNSIYFFLVRDTFEY